MPRRIPGDWHPGVIPDNALIHESAHVETAQCFEPFQGALPVGVEVAAGAVLQLGALLDVGPRGRVRVGSCSMLNCLLVICDELVEIGDYALLSWNVVIMDSYRVALDADSRRRALRSAAARADRRIPGESPARPVRIGRNV